MGERKGDCGRLAVEVNGTFLEHEHCCRHHRRDHRCAVGRRAARRAVRQHRAQQRSRPVLDGRSLRRGGGASAPGRGAQHPDRLEVSGDRYLGPEVIVYRSVALGLGLFFGK